MGSLEIRKGYRQVTMIRAIKSDSGEWVVEICAVPFGSPSDLDSDRQYFSAKTNLHLDRYKSQPLIYYHGFTDAKRPAQKPVYVGQVVEGSHQVRSDGVWVKAVLDKGIELARKVWDAAVKGMAAASSDSVQHLVRYAADGHILEWPLIAVSVFDTYNNKLPANKRAVVLPAMKMIYSEAGLTLPVDIPEPEAEAIGASADAQGADAAKDVEVNPVKSDKGGSMTPEEIAALIAKGIADERARIEAEQKQRADEQARVDAAVKAAKAQWEAESAPQRRLFDGQAPYVKMFSGTEKYDGLDAGEQALMVCLLNEWRATGKSRGPSENAVKALALKALDDKSAVGMYGQQAMKAYGLPMKANEIMGANLAGAGDEWAGVMYSQQLWEKIRLATFLLGKIRAIEVPQGAESLSVPIEGNGFTFYRVGEVTDVGSNGRPNATITTSKGGSAKITIAPKKLGARALWSGEMEEDSLLPFVSWLRDSLVKDGGEAIESLFFDGDTVLTAATNINNAGTAETPATNVYYTTLDGMRKLALITNSANSRAGSTLADTDFLNTLKLMGASGINALESLDSVEFIIDAVTHWLALPLASVKTRDVNSNPTIEDGRLVRIYGRNVRTSAHMNRQSTNRATTATGKIDGVTPANNTKGTLMAVRYDQWLVGWKRRMKLETTRVPSADSTEIVATMRIDLQPRDNEAAALTYNLS